jgi:hypothetical protein
MSSFDCLYPGGRDGTAASLVEVSDNVVLGVHFVDVVCNVVAAGVVGDGLFRLIVEVESPHAVVGVAYAFENDIVVLHDADMLVCEYGFVAIVAELSMDRSALFASPGKMSAWRAAVESCGKSRSDV